jgi:formiminoglutamase
MKDLDLFFQPVNEDYLPKENTLGDKMKIHFQDNFPELGKGGMAIFYVPEFRNGNKRFVGRQEDSFRPYLYQLFEGFSWSFPINDLGTLMPGETIQDTYFAVANVVAELVKNDILPIVIGGSHDLTFGLYKGYEKLEQLINICSVDSRLDVGTTQEELNDKTFVGHLLLQRPCYLFNYANIGCQAPLVGKGELELFEKLYFDVCRLGEFNTDRKRSEPHLRNTDILTIDVEGVRSSDFPTEKGNNPNGFYADQICQIAKYAGLSDKLTSFGVFNLHPEEDSPSASDLVAQMIWYFIDGVSQRKGDFPVGTKKDYLRFVVHLDDFSEDEIVFHKSNKSERWWMEVPYPMSEGQKYLRHHMVPCDHEDYELAMKNEIPDLWWKTYQKLG